VLGRAELVSAAGEDAFLGARRGASFVHVAAVSGTNATESGAAEKRYVHLMEGVAGALGDVSAVARKRDMAGAKALEVTSACDAILEAQRRLVLEAEAYDDALADLEDPAGLEDAARQRCGSL